MLRLSSVTELISYERAWRIAVNIAKLQEPIRA
jgi:hypothetical protein